MTQHTAVCTCRSNIFHLLTWYRYSIVTDRFVGLAQLRLDVSAQGGGRVLATLADNDLQVPHGIASMLASMNAHAWFILRLIVFCKQLELRKGPGQYGLTIACAAATAGPPHYQTGWNCRVLRGADVSYWLLVSWRQWLDWGMPSKT